MVHKTLLILLIALLPSLAFCQVGIGTNQPQADLHIAGELLVQDTFTISPLPSVNMMDENFKLLTRTTNSALQGEITLLDVDSLTVAPINVVNYSFSNIRSDNLTDVNLQYDADRYVVGIANFRYLGDAIKKIPVNGTATIGTFVIRTFVSNGQWHMEIRNRDLDLDGGDSLQYLVTLIVYDKSYYRHMEPIVTNLGGSNTGTASSVPILY